MTETVQESPVTLEEYAALDWEGKIRVWLDISDITKEQFEAHMTAQQAREAGVPRVGEMAPDFTADILDRSRMRTGEMVRLSDLRGKPVGLVFGSYT
ncbi:MAG: hypothetical protein QF384_22050 [Alphaproteobacteria bacterium]|jgi:hypothetical protein|nr:hypothetical protein [Alphaproteobacteria bacterium]MDP6832609.1 hypothetical protein [Alphaproteobacteria bacterium]MDP6876168.1 hypothetical protein [Alphaproteobacteria bacterium]